MASRWPDEPMLYPYTALRALSARRLLVLAPHPDDEVLGCGGLIVASLQDGASVDVVIASSGDKGGDALVREAESRAAAQVLAGSDGACQPSFWRLPDRQLADDRQLVSRVQHRIISSGADAVLLPSPFEIHPDHRALCLAGLHAMRSSDVDADLLFYEVGQPLMPDVLLDITAQVERKRAALRCFSSQLAVQAYDEQLLGLNRFRAYTLGPTVTHAEAFQRVSPAVWRGGLPAVLADIDARLQRRFEPLPGSHPDPA
jgi:LmbE family N-acetylglucosaminyl deacetylase